MRKLRTARQVAVLSLALRLTVIDGFGNTEPSGILFRRLPMILGVPRPLAFQTGHQAGECCLRRLPEKKGWRARTLPASSM